MAFKAIFSNMLLKRKISQLNCLIVRTSPCVILEIKMLQQLAHLTGKKGSKALCEAVNLLLQRLKVINASVCI